MNFVSLIYHNLGYYTVNEMQVRKLTMKTKYVCIKAIKSSQTRSVCHLYNWQAMRLFSTVIVWLQELVRFFASHSQPGLRRRLMYDRRKFKTNPWNIVNGWWRGSVQQKGFNPWRMFPTKFVKLFFVLRSVNSDELWNQRVYLLYLFMWRLSFSKLSRDYKIYNEEWRF